MNFSESDSPFGEGAHLLSPQQLEIGYRLIWMLGLQLIQKEESAPQTSEFHQVSSSIDLINVLLVYFTISHSTLSFFWHAYVLLECDILS